MCHRVTLLPLRLDVELLLPEGRDRSLIRYHGFQVPYGRESMSVADVASNHECCKESVEDSRRICGCQPASFRRVASSHRRALVSKRGTSDTKK